MKDPKYISTRELAALFKVTPQTICDWARCSLYGFPTAKNQDKGRGHAWRWTRTNIKLWQAKRYIMLTSSWDARTMKWVKKVTQTLRVIKSL